MNNRVEKTVIGGLSWSFAERICAQGVSFIVSVVLARLLAPEQFGTISLILVFINIANVFVSYGFGESLIQKTNSDETDFSTVFWCSFLFSIILSIIIWLIAPVAGNFYNTPDIVWPMRVLGFKVILASANSIQMAYISKHLMFKKMFYATFVGTAISAFVGIICAYLGFGVWALVAQYMSNSIIDTIALFIVIDWRPRFVFSVESAKKLIGYGWKITGASLINTIYAQIRSIIIGKIYSTADLAYYTKADKFPSLIMTNLNTAINKVFFPVMSKYNSNRQELKHVTIKALKGTAAVTFPIMGFLVLSADKVIPFLLTEKWNHAIPYMRILCLFWLLQPIQTANWQVLKASGRSDLCLKLEVVKKIIGIGLVLATMNISVIALAWSSVAFAVISTTINMIPNRKIIDYSVFEQIIDIFPYLCISFIACILAYPVSYINLPYFLAIVMEAVIVFVVYAVLLGLFQFKSLRTAYSEIKKFIKK